MGDPKKRINIVISNQAAITKWADTKAIPYLAKKLQKDFKGFFASKQTVDKFRRRCLSAIKSKNVKNRGIYCGAFTRLFLSVRAAAEATSYHLMLKMKQQAKAKARKVKLKPKQRVVKVSLTKLTNKQLNVLYRQVIISFIRRNAQYAQTSTFKAALAAIIKSGTPRPKKRVQKKSLSKKSSLQMR